MALDLAANFNFLSLVHIRQQNNYMPKRKKKNRLRGVVNKRDKTTKTRSKWGGKGRSGTEDDRVSDGAGVVGGSKR